MSAPATAKRGFGSAYRWVILIVIGLLGLMSSIDRVNISISAPTIATNFGLASTAVGLLLSASVWAYIVTQIPGGYLAQKLSPHWVLTVVFVIFSVGTILCGLVANAGELIAARVVVGLADGAIIPTSLVLLTRWFPAGQRARAISIVWMTATVGYIVGAPLTGLLVQQSGWRAMFFIEGFISVALAIGAAALLRDRPRVPLAATASVPNESEAERPRWYDVLRIPSLWLVIATFTVAFGAVGAIGVWFPTMVAQSTGASPQLVGLISVISPILILILTFANGWLSDRIKRRDVAVLWPICIGIVALAATYLTTNPNVRIALVIVASLAGVAAAMFFAWVTDLVAERLVGVATGLLQMAGQLATAIMTVVVGAVAVGGVLNTAWIFLVMLIVAAILVVVMIVRSRRSPKIGEFIHSASVMAADSRSTVSQE